MKKKLFSLLTHVLPTNLKDTIIVAGAPRSGTTWLAELLRELPGYKLINEPLRLSTNPRARAAGFDWRTHVRPGEKCPALRRHLQKIFRGHVELGPAWHFRSEHLLGKLAEHVTHNRAVVKFCRAGRMLHWMAEQFRGRGIVVIIRHPCAVIASMLNMGDNWQPRNLEGRSLKQRFDGQIPESVASELRTIPGAVDSWVGHLAIQWSLDHYFALHEHTDGPNNYPWILTTYERLFTDGERELERIVQALGAHATVDMRNQMATASSFAASDFQPNQEHQLTKWRSEFSAEQIDLILNVVGAFDLDFYTEGVLPDFDHLRQYQRPSVRWGKE